MALLTVAASVAGAVVLLWVAFGGRRTDDEEPEAFFAADTDDRRLPVGAEAALWWITEAVPDPRNHLALKDPTSELTLTAEERAAAEAAITPRVSLRPAEAARARVEALRAAGLSSPRRPAATIDVTDDVSGGGLGSDNDGPRPLAGVR